MTIERPLKAFYSHCMMRATVSFTRALKMVNNAGEKCYLTNNRKTGRGQRGQVVVELVDL